MFVARFLYKREQHLEAAAHLFLQYDKQLGIQPTAEQSALHSLLGELVDCQRIEQIRIEQDVRERLGYWPKQYSMWRTFVKRSSDNSFVAHPSIFFRFWWLITH